MKIKKIVVLAGIVFLAGCAMYYPPATQHVYTTSTQAPHRLTGLKIVCWPEDASSVLGPVAQAAFLTSFNVEYFIDGRLVGRHNSAKPFETFVQVPPGEHQLNVLAVSQGLTTLGMKSTSEEAKYEFELEEGQKGSFELEVSIRAEDQEGKEEKSCFILKDFSGVEDWSEE